MKKVFVLMASVTILSTTFAQIQVRQVETKPEAKVGEVKQVGNFLAELAYKVEDKDTIYTLRYRNAEYKQVIDIQSVKFEGVDNTLNSFYAILKSVFKDENKKNKDYKVAFKLGETEVIVSTYRLMGMTSCMFYTSKGHTFLSEKQIDKLFGKDN